MPVASPGDLRARSGVTAFDVNFDLFDRKVPIASLLERPVYTYRGGRLRGLNPGTAKRWINGYRRNGREYEPIVREVGV